MIPHCCPVCEGRGTVPGGFYTRLPVLTPETCRSCSGTGIVWGIETPPPILLPGTPWTTPSAPSTGDPPPSPFLGPNTCKTVPMAEAYPGQFMERGPG